MSSAQRPSGRIRSSTSARFSLVPASCDVQEALLLGAAGRRLEHHLEGEARQPRERVGVDEQAVVDAVELHRGAAGRRDHARRADHLDRVAADAR